MKVWITKYALTKGIYEVAVINSQDDENSVGVYCPNLPYSHQRLYKPDWHETHEEAVARADEMRLKKIESLQKQINNLENLKFE